MPAPRRAPRQGKARAAKAEVEKATPKEVAFLDHTLTLRPELPGTLALDLGELEMDRNLSQLGLLVAALKLLLGEDGYRQVREIIGEAGVDLKDINDPLEALVEDIYGAYGSSLGEAEASAPS